MSSPIEPSFSALLVRHLYHREAGGRFGIERQFRVRYFIDLMGAVHIEEDLEVLSPRLASALERVAGSEAEVAGPKRGNGILIRDVARRLGRASALVRDEPLFDRWIEGVLTPGATVVLVDDVSSDGQLLAQAALRLRTSGHSVDTCVVLVDRPEGDSKERLAEIGVELVPVYQLSDEELSVMEADRRAGRAPRTEE